MSRAPCPTCPRLAACLAHHDDACADLRVWRGAKEPPAETPGSATASEEAAS